jgi:DHA2 family lincomycin resistance protein-like MFS transporter
MISIVSAIGGRVYDRHGPRPLAIPGALVWIASIWFLSAADENSSVWVLLVAYLVMTGSQAMMWAPMTTLALSSLSSDLYPHGTAAFTTAQQLAGAVGGAVLVSAYTIGAKATHAGDLSVAQTVDAGQNAFTAAGILAFGALVAVLLIGRYRAPAAAPAPAEPAQVAP